ncbi:hypothetical protein SmJEL517_g02503 [Synchytrium microbalum]|uniref:Glutathione peroxidase n=1 Tax=Synchytrium microbalum TaxID=1806994 RepID=A0A507C1T8_9FUNG|nr:uncharacterized protein SmJEL517_g02503 [Synchytrium microbalum]TPX35087.1 hypothetical protein SmJEL517_g02503 [Synchytrium microbalum]
MEESKAVPTGMFKGLTREFIRFLAMFGEYEAGKSVVLLSSKTVLNSQEILCSSTIVAILMIGSAAIFRKQLSSIFVNQQPLRALSSAMTAASFYDLQATTLTGKPFLFAELKGKVVLVVNTASACGFTHQYAGLEKMYQALKDKGLVVIGFPCNQFGSQESGTEEEIGHFCQKNYGVTFPIMSKIDVNGDNTHPVYQWLKARKSQFGLERIKWNFEKFLVDKNGEVVQRYSSVATPAEIEKTVEAML